MSIPRKIHYCWFGKKPKGKLVENCIRSWREVLHDYEIIEWNESNYSSDSFFYKSSMSRGKYAFASDYARFDILGKHGGVYLDTDMLFVKSINELLASHCFFGYENEQHFISCGVIGAEKSDPFINVIKTALDAVNTEDFFNRYTIVQVVSAAYYKIKDEQPQLLPQIFPVDYFYSYPYAAAGDPLSYVTPSTFAVHLWNASWVNEFNRAELMYKQGRKKEARKLYFKYLLQHPLYIRFAKRFFS